MKCCGNPLERMLERVCWYKHSKMESWSCYVCLVMKCSKDERQTHITKGEKPQAFFSCCWKGRVKKSMWTKPPTKKYNDQIEIGRSRMKNKIPSPQERKQLGQWQQWKWLQCLLMNGKRGLATTYISFKTAEGS